ncbi:MAG: AMP-binding protein [Syntrophomonadaceae bacterium]
MKERRQKITDLISSQITDVTKTAIELYSGEVLTYGELIQLIRQTKVTLERFDIKPHQRIAFVSGNPLTFPIMLGVIETATLAALDPTWNVQQYLEHFELLGIDYLMSDVETGTAVDAATIQGIGIINFQMLQKGTVDIRLAAESRLVSNQPYKSDLIACVYTTSGTTSIPKVVPRIYNHIVESINIRASYHDFGKDSIQLLPIKFYYEIAIFQALISLITNGMVIYTDGAYPSRIVAALQKYPITDFIFQPAGMIALIDYMEKNNIPCGRKHRMNTILAGASLPMQLKNNIERHFNAQVIDAYGMTEAGLIASTYKAPQGYKQGSVGAPVGVEIRIHDGEVQISGPCVFHGYENNPQANEASFVEGWFRTGDAGYLDDDGYLFITGRIKELINRGGEKVSPHEVEKAIRGLGNIKDICVFPYPNSKGYENVGAVIVSDSENLPGLRELRSALKDKIKPFKLPTILYRVDQIPVSSANKVQRNLLYEQLQSLGYDAESLAGASFIAEDDFTSTQYVIHEIWKGILEQEFISLDDNFFDIGGDSLSAAEVLASIEAKFGCMLPVNDFFAKSTIRELAALVDETPKFNPYNHLVPFRLGGSKTPIFFVHERSGDVVTYHHVVDNLNQEHPVYGLNLNLLKEAWSPTTSMRDVALAYAREIQMVSETGPYYLAGLSVGGQIAFEVGSVLAERGFQVIVFMMDTYSQKQIRDMSVHYSTRGTLLNIKQIPVAQWPKLARKKVGTLYREFIQPELASRIGHKDTGRFEKKWDVTDSAPDRQSVFLRSIISNHRPNRLSGKVIYFRALQNKLKRNPSYLFWKSLSGEFKLIETDCKHDDFVKPEYAAYTAGEINIVLETCSTSSYNL